MSAYFEGKKDLVEKFNYQNCFFQAELPQIKPHLYNRLYNFIFANALLLLMQRLLC